jgi:hypothetical protein
MNTPFVMKAEPNILEATNLQLKSEKQHSFTIQVPDITLLKGGGIVKRINELFQVNSANGTAGTFISSGTADLLSALRKDDIWNWIKDKSPNGLTKRYKPRTEGSFSKIGRIRDHVVSVFGKGNSAQIFDEKDETKISKWSLEFSYNDRGNGFLLEYKQDNKTNDYSNNQCEEYEFLNTLLF